MRLTITTYNVLEMLGEWKIARPYNFLLLPMVDPVYGFAFHRQSNEKVLLVCAFSSKQDQWLDLECVNVHNGKQYKMLNCTKTNGSIPYNVVFPSQFAHLLIQYQQHPEAKSLAPDGNPCIPDTRGLLKRVHVLAGEVRYIGKETDHKWAREYSHRLAGQCFPTRAEPRCSPGVEGQSAAGPRGIWPAASG